MDKNTLKKSWSLLIIKFRCCSITSYAYLTDYFVIPISVICNEQISTAVPSQEKLTTPVRETGVSRYNGIQIKAPIMPPIIIVS